MLLLLILLTLQSDDGPYNLLLVLILLNLQTISMPTEYLEVEQYGLLRLILPMHHTYVLSVLLTYVYDHKILRIRIRK